MLSSRQQLFVLAVGLAAAVVVVSGTSLSLGVRVRGDGPVCYGVVNVRAQRYTVVGTQWSCKVPRHNQNITQITARDMGARGKGGYARVFSGGLGRKNVTLILESQNGQPLNFTLQVFAKPYW